MKVLKSLKRIVQTGAAALAIAAYSPAAFAEEPLPVMCGDEVVYGASLSAEDAADPEKRQAAVAAYCAEVPGASEEKKAPKVNNSWLLCGKPALNTYISDREGEGLFTSCVPEDYAAARGFDIVTEATRKRWKDAVDCSKGTVCAIQSLEDKVGQKPGYDSGAVVVAPPVDVEDAPANQPASVPVEPISPPPQETYDGGNRPAASGLDPLLDDILEEQRTHIDDNDGDGWLNGDDNCPDNYNPDQIDTDNDSYGDRCDPYPNGEVPLSFVGGSYLDFVTEFNVFAIGEEGTYSPAIGLRGGAGFVSLQVDVGYASQPGREASRISRDQEPRNIDFEDGTSEIYIQTDHSSFEHSAHMVKAKLAAYAEGKIEDDITLYGGVGVAHNWIRGDRTNHSTGVGRFERNGEVINESPIPEDAIGPARTVDFTDNIWSTYARGGLAAKLGERWLFDLGAQKQISGRPGWGAFFGMRYRMGGNEE